MLTGYAVRFNERSEPMHGANGAEFVEEVIPGALARLRERRDVKALIGHDPTKVIGSTRSGTLTLIPDAIGLRFELQPPNSPTGHDLIESVRRGDLDGVSFGFRTIADKWLPDTRPPVRQLLDVDVFELSIVAWPAYREAGVIIEPRALEYAAELVTCESRQLRARELDALTVRLRAIR
ncbi:phage prohead protease, HK97 family [Luteitalea pratensis]|uniref:Phage prohead protease, HK97 family n=2 Tax=Luteitalea pratensis TaxID=1855912 RepID=A0A143PRR4_LUTPR|nr:phage prohead protease, HK97 family [Luteitalea pratensis]